MLFLGPFKNGYVGHPCIINLLAWGILTPFTHTLRGRRGITRRGQRPWPIDIIWFNQSNMYVHSSSRIYTSVKGIKRPDYQVGCRTTSLLSNAKATGRKKMIRNQLNVPETEVFPRKDDPSKLGSVKHKIRTLAEQN